MFYTQSCCLAETMNSSLDVVTSLWSDDPGVNVTTAANVTGRLVPRGGVSPAVAATVRVTILAITTVFGLCGNGFTLITIRYTPRLWTKTNFILASMLTADLLTAAYMFLYLPFLLVVYVFNNPCLHNVLTTISASILRIPGIVSLHHLIVISVERYIAIVYPLHYENMFTIGTLKRTLFAVWTIGVLFGTSYALWLINADPRACNLIPAQYSLVDIILGYIPVCVSLFTCYGRILAISLRHRRQIEPINVHSAVGPSLQTVTTTVTGSYQADSSDNTVDSKDKPPAGVGRPTNTAGTSGTAELTQEQQRQIKKSRRREYKAVYLTASIVGVFVVLWFPTAVGRILASVGYNPITLNHMLLAAGAIGAVNFNFSWVVYAAASKSYRRAYRQMLTRIGCCCCKNINLQPDNSLII